MCFFCRFDGRKSLLDFPQEWNDNYPVLIHNHTKYSTYAKLGTFTTKVERTECLYRSSDQEKKTNPTCHQVDLPLVPARRASDLPARSETEDDPGAPGLSGHQPRPRAAPPRHRGLCLYTPAAGCGRGGKERGRPPATKPRHRRKVGAARVEHDVAGQPSTEAL